MAHPNLQNLHVGRAGHPLNLRCRKTNIELIWCPRSKAWLKFGCAKTQHPSLRTHIWQEADAEKYLASVITQLRAGTMKVITIK